MKTKEVVALMNISQDTLRYYEKVGVIPPVNRDENGYRIYNDSDLNWIYLVKNLRNAGVSIESLIDLKTIHDARDLLQYKIDNYDNHIAKINASDNHDDNVERLWERK